MEKNDILKGLNEAYFSSEPHERELIDMLPELLRNSKVFVDVGASLGQYTYYANKILRDGIIISFEADTLRYEELERNCDKWESESSNKLTAVHAAINDYNGEAKFFTTGSSVSGGVFPRNVPDESVNWHEIKVKSLTMDGYFQEYTPDFVKIDIEGAELAALKGARNILKEGKTRFLIEVHKVPGHANPADVLSFMMSFDYYPKVLYGRILFEKKRGSLRRRLEVYLHMLYLKIIFRKSK